jgi:putative hydrolase of the HAD superfamily
VEVADLKLTTALEEVRLAWERAWSAGTHLPPAAGAEMLVGALGLREAARATVAEAFLGALEGVPLELAPGIDSTLAGLAERGIRLGIVCDVGFSGGEVLRGLLRREGLLDRFDGWAFSDEVGHYKPSPQIFEGALGALGARPGEAVHVGDLRRTDVAGAAALGMRTVRYTGMHDDTDTQTAVEAEFVVDSHLEVPELISRLAADD